MHSMGISFSPWLAFIMQVHLDTDGNTRNNLCHGETSFIRF